MVNNPSRLTINDIAARCEKVKWQGHHSFTACCVAHSDQNPSMAVTEAEDGMILAHCFSGCAQGVVIEALGIRGVKRDDYVPALKVVRKKHKQVPSTFSYAKEIWAASSAPDGRSVGTHPYAVKKRITHAFGVCRVAVSGRLLGKDGDCIVVPNRNWDGELVGVECINHDGVKQTFGFKGLLVLGMPEDASIVHVCEGWATAWAISQLFPQSFACIVVFGKSGLGRYSVEAQDRYKGNIAVHEEGADNRDVWDLWIAGEGEQYASRVKRAAHV